MKPLVKATIPFNEVVAMADSLLAKEPEWFKPFFDGRVPSWDEVVALVVRQVAERRDDESGSMA
jgi:hypothetical protein